MNVKDALASLIRQRYDQCPPGRWPMEDSLAEYIVENATLVGLVVTVIAEPSAPVDYSACCGSVWEGSE